ncbi:thioredoxin family protein [Prosthecodimorpha staleyi]|uniref:Thioredoxin family protein n=1 Tax=Prosthecodimorpha staleyi TaxID=2840188 RepID=A0A947D7V3_9HYPH|nr:thioredoxin family protein [Prosthecodimorpha staleyi]MBT9291998.1 thioredoxin family protein [Prosthecodimorpha staleyi]
MLHRRSLLALSVSAALAASALAIAPSARAAEPAPFSAAAFTAAKAKGGPILVEVTAPWCPTCRAQKPILSELRAMPKFKDMTVLTVDFDSQKDALRALDARTQSTLIVFKGDREVGRSVGVTERGAIEALLAKSL